jgi:hypothetical protein
MLDSFSQGSGGVGILTLFHSQQKKTNHFCTVVSKKSANNENKEKEFERLYACQMGMSQPHQNTAWIHHTFLLTNGC